MHSVRPPFGAISQVVGDVIKRRFLADTHLDWTRIALLAEKDVADGPHGQEELFDRLEGLHYFFRTSSDNAKFEDTISTQRGDLTERKKNWQKKSPCFYNRPLLIMILKMVRLRR